MNRFLCVSAVIVSTCVASALVVVLEGDDAGEAEAAGVFSERTIRGRWGFNGLGRIVPPAFDPPAEAAAVGIMTFDGEGGLRIDDVININGTAIGPRTSTSGSYTVNPDGTGEMVVQFIGDPGPTPLSFVIVDRRREIRFIRTDLGVGGGVAKRQ